MKAEDVSSNYRRGLTLIWLGFFLCLGFGLNAEETVAPSNSVVVRVRDAKAVKAFVPEPQQIRQMVSKGVRTLTNVDDASVAWRALVKKDDVIGIKVFSRPGATSGTRIPVVAAVIEELLDIGIPETNIVVWDKRLADLQLAGFMELKNRYGVDVVGSAEKGYDPGKSYETSLIGNLVWGDLEFGKKGELVGKRSFLSKLLTERITRIISITPLLNHNQASVTGHLYSLAFGSVDNTLRFQTSTEHMNVAVPEIFAMPEIYDRLALVIQDGLICQYEGEKKSLLHYSNIMSELWFSFDPVALDATSIRVMNDQRRKAEAPLPVINSRLYDNAALMKLGMASTNRIDETLVVLE